MILGKVRDIWDVYPRQLIIVVIRNNLYMLYKYLITVKILITFPHLTVSLC
jgi:hypothetical protein